MKKSLLLLGILFCLLTALTCSAGVTVVQNVSPGATSWPGSPLIQSMSNPTSQATVGESFNGGGGCTNYSETFTITTTNYTLQTISLYAGGGTGTGSGTNLTLRLFDLGALGSQSATNSSFSAYTPGTDLFNSGSGLAVAYSPQTTGVLQFNFTGVDQVALTNGHIYAFEVDGVLNTQPVSWQRSASATYSGGSAYRNRSWINGNGNFRAFSLAVYATVLANTNTGTTTTNNLWVPSGIVFHAFTAPSGGVNQDGANPAAGLTLSGGVLVGTTLNGGSQGAGAVFYMTPDGTNFSVFRSFANTPDAANPQGNLMVAGNGLFGTSLAGGNNGVGTVFLGSTSGSVSILRSFAVVSEDEATNSGGASPSGFLAPSGNTLYGTTTAGGTAANGTVFSLSTNGVTFSVLHDFSVLDANTGTNPDGALPCGGLILSGNTLYGTASAGGTGGAGVIFSVNTSGSSFTTLYSFTPLDSLAATNTDGAFPLSGLMQSNGMLYGTTLAGGNGGKGTIFSIGTNGTAFAVLHNFSATDPLTGTNSDGASPCAALALAGSNLYGTAAAGGTSANGTVFSVSTDGTQFQTLHAFPAIDPSTGTNFDGALPVAGVLPVGNSLYGTTFSGGPGGVGTVFNLTIPYPPAVITGIVHNSDGSAILSFLGGPNSTNIIQTTASLTPPVVWQNVSTNVADAGGAWQFSETDTTKSNRFYRSYAP
jgi:uncharacterized repeat protein (TIGR03803 family)